MTVIFTSPFFKLSSLTVPKIILAFGSTDSVIILAASWISNIPKSAPPAIEKRTPFAPFIEISKRGEFIAIFAASSALFSPLAVPMPIRAEPASVMIALISAKSILIIPGMVIRSEMPSTADFKTSSHMAKAVFAVVSLPIVERSLSFGMTMIASTACRNSSRPVSAIFILC